MASLISAENNTLKILRATVAIAMFAILGLMGASPARSDSGSAPTLVENIHGYTLADDKLQKFSCLVFALGKVVAVGDAGTLRGQYPTAKVIEGQGKTLLPGLIDAHGHVVDLGFQGVQVQLFGTTTLAQAQDKIRAYAKAYPDGPWVLGGGWNQVQWKIGRFPTAAELDAAVADRPAVLDRVDGQDRRAHG